MIKIVDFDRRYAAQVAKVFHAAVNGIEANHYKAEQLYAWSAAPRSARHWQNRLTRTQAWVAIDDTKAVGDDCVGFINLETGFQDRGYIDSLYVLPTYQHQGVANQLYQQLESWALSEQYQHLTTDASIISKPLFSGQGFCQLHKTYQQKSGQIIKGFYMEKSFNCHGVQINRS